jgi:hypothetical protein
MIGVARVMAPSNNVLNLLVAFGAHRLRLDVDSRGET